MQIRFLFSVWLVLFSLTIFAQDNTIATSRINDRRLQWWHQSKFGMFIHWGPVTLTGKEISWSRNASNASQYDSLYLHFNPVKFNAKEWIENAKAAGMKYIVFTAKHHDGFCNWNTSTTSYNIMNTPLQKDVCKELAEAAHEAGIKLGWYYSPADWKDIDCRNPNSNQVYEQRMLKQIEELLTNYGKVDLLWIDYEGSPCPGNPASVYQLARKLQPEIIVNNRLDVFNPDESHSNIGPNGDYATPEGFVAGYGNYPWETCTNLGSQWAWRFNDKPQSLKEVAQTLLRCVGGNGNLLLNIGPDSLGQMPENFVQRLQQLGSWINARHESIYGTNGGSYTPAPNYVCTRKGKTLYLHLFDLKKEVVTLPPLPATIRKTSLLDGTPVQFKQTNEGLFLTIPAANRDSIATTIAITTRQSAEKIKLVPPISSSGSLAYKQKAMASSSMGQFLHDASAAFDDNPNTYWKLGRKKDADFAQYYGKSLHYRTLEIKKLYENRGWLQVELNKPEKISSVKISEYVIANSVVKSFEVQYELKGKWVVLAKGTKMQNWEQSFPPVIAKKFRLVINDSDGFFGIKEFQLFN